MLPHFQLQGPSANHWVSPLNAFPTGCTNSTEAFIHNFKVPKLVQTSPEPRTGALLPKRQTVSGVVQSGTVPSTFQTYAVQAHGHFATQLQGGTMTVFASFECACVHPFDSFFEISFNT